MLHEADNNRLGITEDWLARSLNCLCYRMIVAYIVGEVTCELHLSGWNWIGKVGNRKFRVYLNDPEI